ncbi:MAG: histidine phosphatase family protein [Telmatospirillum sp.]|nr:histidine phosphatase family protein [Telmatospirillum sp.]
MRHAKSSWADPGRADFERPLNARGRKAALAMAEWLAARNLAPDLILCSAARRTRETLAAVRPALGPTAEVSIEQRLYLAEEDQLFARLVELDDLAQPPGSAILIGHNPGLGDLALRLIPRERQEIRRRIAAKFPTCAFVDLAFACETWEAIDARVATLNDYLVPAELEK